MAKAKAAGKEKKAAPAAQEDPQAQVAGAHLDKPAAVEHPGADQSSGVVHSEAKASQVKPGTVALVSKGGDKVPVQLKDDAHLEKLIGEHGKANVRVQS